MTTTLIKSLTENRTYLHPVSWPTFSQLLIELGCKRNTRLTYSENTLEIMTPLGEHENSNRFIDDLIRILTDELNLPLKRMGSLILKKNDLKQAIEPDSSYYIHHESLVRNQQNIDLNTDPPPDLVLEIDITSGSLNKLPIYAALQILEIWRYDGTQLEVFILDKNRSVYHPSKNSLIFPDLVLEMIPRLLQQSLIEGETATLKAFRKSLKSNTQ